MNTLTTAWCRIRSRPGTGWPQRLGHQCWPAGRCVHPACVRGRGAGSDPAQECSLTAGDLGVWVEGVAVTDKSCTVTVHGPHASGGSGFWLWAVADIPASVAGLPAGAGDDTGEHLPAGAFQLRNDLRQVLPGCGRLGRPAPERTNRDRWIARWMDSGMDRAGWNVPGARRHHPARRLVGQQRPGRGSRQRQGMACAVSQIFPR